MFRSSAASSASASREESPGEFSLAVFTQTLIDNAYPRYSDVWLREKIQGIKAPARKDKAWQNIPLRFGSQFKETALMLLDQADYFPDLRYALLATLCAYLFSASTLQEWEGYVTLFAMDVALGSLFNTPLCSPLQLLKRVIQGLDNNIFVDPRVRFCVRAFSINASSNYSMDPDLSFLQRPR